MGDHDRQVLVGRRQGPHRRGRQRLLDVLAERVGLVEIRVVVERRERRRQTALDGVHLLVVAVAQAHGGVEGGVLVLRVAADREVDPADRHVGRLAFLHPRVGRPLEVLEHLGLVLLHRRVDERIVHLEGGGARLHGQPVVVLLLHRQRRVGGRGGGQPLHDGERVDRRLPHRWGVAGLVQDAPTRAGQQRVEPDGDALVLVALDLDEVRLALPWPAARTCRSSGPRSWAAWARGPSGTRAAGCCC